jgi:hypothetical protein
MVAIGKLLMSEYPRFAYTDALQSHGPAGALILEGVYATRIWARKD